MRFDGSEVTFDLAPGVVAQQQQRQQQQSEYRGYSSSRFGALGIGGGIASTAASGAATAAFQGEGRQLGSSINHSGGDDNDYMTHMAINASLRSLAEELSAGSEKRKKRRNCSSDEGAPESCKEDEEGASAKKRSGGADGTKWRSCWYDTSCGGVIDLVGEGSCDDEETKNGGNLEKDYDIVVIHE